MSVSHTLTVALVDRRSFFIFKSISQAINYTKIAITSY